MDEAVRAVFAALVWHSQRLRDEIKLFGKEFDVDRMTNMSTVRMTGKKEKKERRELRREDKLKKLIKNKRKRKKRRVTQSNGTI